MAPGLAADVGPRRAVAVLLAAVLAVLAARALGQAGQHGNQPSIVVLYSQSTSSQAAKVPLSLRAATQGVSSAGSGLSSALGLRQNLVTDASAAARSPKTADAVAAPQTPVRADGDVLQRGRSPTPRCANGQPFCLYDQEYPQQRVHEILNTYHDDANTLYHALHRYNPQELINRDNQTHNYRHRGHFACESEVAYLRPGWARNWKDEWVAVVNTDKFPQMVRVETCKFLNQKCEFLPPCYKSSCTQRFAATRLLCVDPANPHQRPIIDVFEMPVACSCFVENFRFL